jgi:DNA-binding beta-propeller fold protein YncE
VAALIGSSLSLRAATPPGTSLINTIELSPGGSAYSPGQFGLNQATHKLYTLAPYIVNVQPCAAAVINTATGSFVTGIRDPKNTVTSDGGFLAPYGLAVDDSTTAGGNKVYYVSDVGYSSTRRLVLVTGNGATDTIDPNTAVSLPISEPASYAGNAGIGVNPVNHKVYVSDYYGTVAVVDGPTHSVIKTIQMPSGNGANVIVAIPASNKMLAFPYGPVVLIDSSSDSLTTLSIPSFYASDAAYDSANGRIYAVGQDPNGTTQLIVFDGSGAIVASTTAGVPSGAKSIAVDAAGGKVYVGTPTPSDTNGTITVFSATSLAVIGSFPQGAGKLAIDSTNNSRIYLLDARTELLNQVGVLNVNNGSLARLTVGYRPGALAVNRQTNRTYVTDARAPELVVIDGASDSVSARVAVKPATIGGAVYDYQTIPRLIAVSEAVNRIYLPRLAINPVDGTQGIVVDVLDGSTNALITTISVGSPYIYAMAVDDTRRHLLIATQGTMYVYGLDSNSLVATAALTGSVFGMVANPATGRIYLGILDGGGYVTVLDGDSYNVVAASVASGAGPVPTAVDQKRNKIYVANTAAGSVANSFTVIDGATNSSQTIDNISSNIGGDAVGAVAVDEVSNTVYVLDNANGSGFPGWVTVYSAANNYSFLGEISVGAAPTGMAFNSTSRQLFVTNENDGTVSVLLNGTRPPPPVPAHGGLSDTYFSVDGYASGGTVVNGTPLAFLAQQSGTPAGLNVRVQFSTTPNDPLSWAPLPNGTDGFMVYDSSSQQFAVMSSSYPLTAGVYFRAISAAPSYPDSISSIVGPFNLTSSTPRLGPTTLYISRNGPVANIRFGVTEATIPAGTAVRIQATKTPASAASWADIDNGSLTQDSTAPNQFYLGLDNYPSGEGVFFRALATEAGYVDSISQEIGPIAFILDPAATVAISLSNGLAKDVHGGEDFDFPLTLHTGSFDVTATAQSGRPINYVGLKYDGDTLGSFGSAASEGNTVNYKAGIAGDHLVEAIATDDLGVIGDARPVHVRVAPAAPGRMLFAGRPGNWSDPSMWIDSNGISGVPGPDDFAVLSSVDVSLPSDVNVKAVSLNGGTISGPGKLTVSGFLTIGGGRIKSDLEIPAGATCLMINDADAAFGGQVTNGGRFKLHGKGGITGIKTGTNAGTAGADGIAGVQPDGFFDGVLGFFRNLGSIIFHRPAGGRPGSGSAPPPAPSPTPAPEVRTVAIAGLENSGLVAAGGGNLISEHGGGVISNDGGSLISHDSGTLVSAGGGNLVAAGGGNLVAAGGGNLVAAGGGNLVAAGGGNLVATGGGNLVSAGGGNIVSAGGGNIIGLSNQRAESAASGFTQTAGQMDLTSLILTGPLTLNGGVLKGTGLILGDLTNNAGFVSPGHTAAGLLAVTGNYTQGVQGTLIIENGGPSPSQFDQLQVGGLANLGGKLDIKTINGYTPDPADTFSPLGFGSVSGTFASVSSNAQVTVAPTGLLTSVDPTKPQPTTGQPLNIATRLQIQSGDNVLIGGFIITGPAGSTKKVLIRGIGPSLANFGVAGTIPDPFLELHKPDGSVVTNDNWQQAPNVAEIPSGFAPSNDLESIIYTSLSPGNYTAILKGAHGEAGVGLVEAYDFDTASTAKLANIATRGFVNTGDNVMIGGFIIGGTEPANVLVRAIGPSLIPFVQGALQATTLELHDANGGVISNDGWRNTQESEIQATTIPPTNDNEAAILATLVPGNYTAIVRGKNNTTGIAVIEAYNLQ